MLISLAGNDGGNSGKKDWGNDGEGDSQGDSFDPTPLLLAAGKSAENLPAGKPLRMFGETCQHLCEPVAPSWFTQSVQHTVLSYFFHPQTWLLR